MSLEQLDHAVSVLAGFATVIAAATAVWGIRAWRHQLHGTTEYRAALRAYKAVALLRDRIRSTREGLNHMVPLGDGEDADTAEFVERERKQYFTFFSEVIRADLGLLKLRAEVELLWGFDATNHLDALDDSARKLRGGYRAYFEARHRAVTGSPEYRQYIPGFAKITLNQYDGEDEYRDLMEQRAKDALAFFRARAGLSKTKNGGLAVSLRRGATRAFIVVWAAWAAFLANATLGPEPASSPAPMVSGTANYDVLGDFALSDTSSAWYRNNDPARPSQIVPTIDGQIHDFPADFSREEIREALNTDALGRAARRGFPGTYSDLSDFEFGGKIRDKHPAIWSWFVRREAVRESVAHAARARADSTAAAADRRVKTRAWLAWVGLGLGAPALLLGAGLWTWNGFSAEART